MRRAGGFDEAAEIAYAADADAFSRFSSADWSFLLVNAPIERRGTGKHQSTKAPRVTFASSAEIAAIGGFMRRMSE
jgi:hypothetical protein